VLEHFPPWRGEADGTFAYDSLGVRTDPNFRPHIRPHPRGPLELAHPSPYAPYFELVFVLESVVAAQDSPHYTMVELGAGYGPWMVSATTAWRSLVDRPVRLVGVEMVPHHFEWLHQHFRNNGIDPAEHKLIQGAVTDTGGNATYIPEPDPRMDFGQTVVARGLASSAEQLDGQPNRPVQVPGVTLPDLLADLDAVDLVHVDIQGEELRVLEHSASVLDEKVRRLMVATHSRGIHSALRRQFAAAGWTGVFDFGYRKRVRTPYGDVQFLDGLLAFVNPRRC
jgi:FkbM family methyltransferase